MFIDVRIWGREEYFRFFCSSSTYNKILVFAGVGAAVKAISNGVIAYYNDENIFAEAAGGLVEGAITGLAASTANPGTIIRAGLVGGTLGNAVEQLINGDLDIEEALKEGIVGAATANLSDAVTAVFDAFETWQD